MSSWRRHDTLFSLRATYSATFRIPSLTLATNFKYFSPCFYLKNLVYLTSKTTIFVGYFAALSYLYRLNFLQDILEVYLYSSVSQLTFQIHTPRKKTIPKLEKWPAAKSVPITFVFVPI